MKDNWKQILKLLMGTGMLLVDSDRRERVSSKVRDRVDEFREVASDKYDVAVERAERMADALYGRRNYAAPIGGFLLGVGLGVGLGMLFAPASGEETREKLKTQANDLQERVSQQAANMRGRAVEKVSEIQDQMRDASRGESATSQSPYSRPA